MKRLLILASAALVFTGCSKSEPSAAPPVMTLSEAFCSDLKAGSTPFQILTASIKDGTYTPQQAATSAYTWASDSCPDQLRDNEALRTYLNNWGLDPDA